MGTFQNHVFVNNTETGESGWFKPGDKAPAWANNDFVDPKHFEVKPTDEDGNVIEDEGPDRNYAKLKKNELIDLADERGLETEGTKDELIERLEENDAALS